MPKCLVKGCQHSSGRKSSIPGVALHPFPKDLARIKKWLLQTNQDFGDLDFFAQGILQGQMGVSRICSVHFAPECYSLVGSEKFLLEGAIPTIFPDRDKPATRTEAAASVASSITPWGSGIKITQANMEATNAVRVNSPSASKLTLGKCRKPPTMGIGKSSHPAMSRGNLPGVMLGTETGAMHPDVSSGKVHRAVQWPEYENNVNGEAWKVLHDHYYRVPSATRYPDKERCSLLMDYMSGYRFRSYSGASYWENELFTMLQCVTSFVAVNRNNIKTTRILNQALEIIAMLSEEEWVIVNKNSINKSVQELTGEFPLKCEDVAVYFTTDEWNYIDQHRADYQDVLTHNNTTTHTWEVPEHWDSDTVPVEEEEEVEEFVEEEEVAEFVEKEEVMEEFDDEEEEEEEKEDLEIAKKRVDSSDWEPDSEVESESDVEYEDGHDSGKEDDKSLVKLEEQQLPHPCDQCEESFADVEALEMHKVTHVKKCEDCEEVFNTKAKLIKHRAENHAVKRYACTICGIQYDYKSQFIIHQRAHTGEKPFECDQCGARFAYKSTLLIHERRHVLGKPIECSKCDKRFDKRCEMAKHMRKVHETKKTVPETTKKKVQLMRKKFKCRVCWKSFVTKTLLEKHKWDHDHD